MISLRFIAYPPIFGQSIFANLLGRGADTIYSENLKSISINITFRFDKIGWIHFLVFVSLCDVEHVRTCWTLGDGNIIYKWRVGKMFCFFFIQACHLADLLLGPLTNQCNQWRYFCLFSADCIWKIRYSSWIHQLVDETGGTFFFYYLFIYLSKNCPWANTC